MYAYGCKVRVSPGFLFEVLVQEFSNRVVAHELKVTDRSAVSRSEAEQDRLRSETTAVLSFLMHVCTCDH